MTEGLTYTQLKEYAEGLEKRLRHLLRSQTVQLFDEVDPRTGEYTRNIRRLDTYGVHYKMREYERTGKVPHGGSKVVKVQTKDVERAARAIVKLTLAIKAAKTEWVALFDGGEGCHEITPEMVDT